MVTNQNHDQGSDVNGQHYRPVPSDVSLPRLSERRRRLKFRLHYDATLIEHARRFETKLAYS